MYQIQGDPPVSFICCRMNTGTIEIILYQLYKTNILVLPIFTILKLYNGVVLPWDLQSRFQGICWKEKFRHNFLDTTFSCGLQYVSLQCFIIYYSQKSVFLMEQEDQPDSLQYGIQGEGKVNGSCQIQLRIFMYLSNIVLSRYKQELFCY